MRNVRRAFTLVELLVVIAIIGMLVAMTLPAINAARAAARNVQCQNNVTQLTKAIATYSTQKGSMPAYVRALPVKNAGSNSVLVDFAFSLLPMLEQKVIHDEFMQLVAAGQIQDQDNDGYMDSVSQIDYLASLACPSAPTSESGFVPNYVGNGGHRDYVFMNDEDRPNGALSLSLEAAGGTKPKSYKTTMDYITSHDGTTSTVVVLENARFTYDNQGSWKPRIVSNNNLQVIVEQIEAARTSWWHAGIDVSGADQASDGKPFGSSNPMVFPGLGREDIGKEENDLTLVDRCEKSSPFGFHSDLSNVGYADGHVESISTDISYRVYARLLTSSGKDSARSARDPNNRVIGFYYQDRQNSDPNGP